jgi:Cytochrome c554 and c-prime
LRILKQLTATLAVLLAVNTAFAAQKPPQDSAAACAGCHSSRAQTQPRTSMGRALQPPGGINPILDSHSRLTFQKFGYTYVVETKNGQSSYSVTDGTGTISLPIRWSFGNSAQTWMFERDGVYYESLVSYYPSIGGLEITTGDAEITPTTLDQAVGRKLPPNEPKACFGCHTTGAVIDGRLDLSSFEPGVTCEHCHVGATSHLLSAAQGDVMETAPPDLGKLTSEDLSNFCGQCHRSWEAVIRSPWRGEINVRFQPYRLAISKCFKGTDPRISCITCHDPHKELVADTASYDAKCLACHVTKGAAADAINKTIAKACPIATNNCASCHMPEVKMPNGLTSFHDHRIRIVKPGMPYPD